jgi:molecular chaperone GrpE
VSKKNKEQINDAPVSVSAAEVESVKDADAHSYLKAELEEARKQLAECQDRILRMAADFDNTKKRLEREREITFKYAEENILKELLPSLDNLERALEQGRETNNIASLLEGVEMTWKGLLTSLEKIGLCPIVSLGKSFDPNFHEAVATEVDAGGSDNQVLKEFQKGYLYKDRLLRAAKVVVARGVAASSE